MKPSTDSSRLSEIVKVLVKSEMPDEWGNYTWAEFLKTYAKVADRAGNEVLINSQNKRVSSARTMFVMRDTPKTRAILPTMKIVWRGLAHNILTPPVFTDDRIFLMFETVRDY